MIIFGILRFPSEEVALSVRGRSNRLGHPRFASVKVMHFRRFARRSSDGKSVSFENVSTALGAGSRTSEVEQEGIHLRSCCAWTSQHKLHDSHVSVILPFEEPTNSA